MRGRGLNDVQVRMCVACDRRAPKRTLVRFAVAGDGVVVVVDRGANILGRGAYVCPNIDCFSEAMSTYRFVHALRKRSVVDREGLKSEFLKFVDSGSNFEGERKDG